MTDRIYVTGMGIITGLGIGKEATLQALQQKRPAIGQLKYLQTIHNDLPAAEAPMSNEEMFDFLGIERSEIYTRTALMGRIALKEALLEAKLDHFCKKRIAFISGTTVGGMDQSEKYYRDFLANNEKNAYIEAHDCGATTELIAKEFSGVFDMTTTISTACSSAENAIIFGANLIKTGRADIVVAGGSECLSKFHFNGFHSLMILDKQLCRPFDKTRAGLNLGEGAAFLVIESEKSMRERSVAPIALLAGYGNACDAYHQTASSPNGEGAFLAMQEALKMSGLSASDIDYINAHGTGTENNDLTEGIAIMRIFGDNIPAVSSTKSFTGHTTSAAGSVESIAAILALQHNFVPLNLNFSKKIDELSFVPATDGNPKREMRHTLCNSFGFGGNDSACIFSKVE
ncbi:MAG: beta-ketoacyl-[acyl-carrier-protein] synthase family protein [Bacteroidales bacterium]|jgi:3-oxoacyl-[acyl-carrier-protein] synthase-1|nr:beta-ketoacyl-[acyl-carrier-protein] synthase family protein [Bacteroidales bacterium]